MAKQVIGIGTAPDDGTGDPLRTAFGKVNDNFTELYNDLGQNADSSSPLASVLTLESAAAGQTNLAGANAVLELSKSTGTGLAGTQAIKAGFAGKGAASATVTMTIATPCVVTWTAHGFGLGQKVVLTTTGALPTGLTAGTTYYAVPTGANTFNLATSMANAEAGTVIATSGSQSGTHTGTTLATTQNEAGTIATWGPRSLTGSQTTPLLDLGQTWNTTGNTTALRVNIRDIASNSSSSLIDIQTNSVSRFRVDRLGIIRPGNAGGTIAADSGTVSALIGFYDSTGSSNGFGLFGTVGVGRSLRLDSVLGLGWNVGGNASGWSTGWWYAAAGIIEQRTSTTAQVYRLYRTYTDASNYERLALQSGSGYFELAAETAGTGTDDIDLRLTPAGAGLVRFGAHSALAGETVTGYITIKDAGGTTRKLAVVS